jgi:hypothetical protein
MRRKSQYTSRRTCNTLLWVAFIAFIPSPFLKTQAPTASSEPAIELARESVEDRGQPVFDIHPDIQLSGGINLHFGDLPDNPDKLYSTDSASMIQSTRKAPETSVQWRIAIQESLLYTGVMHTFNLWTEAGTRGCLVWALAQELPRFCR